MNSARNLIFWLFCCSGLCGEEPFVIGTIFAELGNNLFQVATACAVAWDHGATPYFPEMIFNRVDSPYNPQNVPLNFEHIFFRCNISKPDGAISTIWNERDGTHYHPIDYKPNMRLWGYFQSDKYFAHHRDRLLDLFAPHPDDLEYIRGKYLAILDHPCSVAIQIRDQYEDPEGKVYVQYGKNYIREAMTYFSEKDALFVVSSNNLAFAKGCIPEEMKNVIFLEGEPHYIDFFLLSFCKHQILTNSTFGWWCAWLNQNPDKKVIAPLFWYNPHNPQYSSDNTERLPRDWILLNAKWGARNRPCTYE